MSFYMLLPVTAQFSIKTEFEVIKIFIAVSHPVRFNFVSTFQFVALLILTVDPNDNATAVSGFTFRPKVVEKYRSIITIC